MAGPAGERRAPLAGFVRGAMETELQPAELLVGVRIPRVPREVRLGFHKICRKTGEFADAIGVVVVARHGTLCVAAANAVARVAPGGAQRVVTAAELHALRPEDLQPGLYVAVASDRGTCFVASDGFPLTLFEIEAAGPPRVAVADESFTFPPVRHMARSPGGDIYLLGRHQIGVLGPRGIERVFDGISVDDEVPSVSQFTFARDGTLLLLAASAAQAVDVGAVVSVPRAAAHRSASWRSPP